MATREEADKVVEVLQSKFKGICFLVEEGWNDDFYVSVISDPGNTPDLSAILPVGWKARPWKNADQRAELTMIYKD